MFQGNRQRRTINLNGTLKNLIGELVSLGQILSGNWSIRQQPGQKRRDVEDL
jgi:hypothetical protein